MNDPMHIEKLNRILLGSVANITLEMSTGLATPQIVANL